MKLGILIATITMMLSFALNANAQLMWGSGAYGGMQNCNYQQSLGDGAQSAVDDIKEAQSALKEAQRELQAKKRDKKRADRDVERAQKDVESVLSADYAGFIFEHMQSGRSCSEYQRGGGVQDGDPRPPPPVPDDVDHPAQGSIFSFGSNSRMPASVDSFNAGINDDGGGAPGGNENLETGPFSAGEWQGICLRGRGLVASGVCDNQRYRDQGARGADVRSCKAGLGNYRKNYNKQMRLQNEIDSLENAIARAKDDMKDAKQSLVDELRDNTEGGVCVDCIANSGNRGGGRDWAGVIGNVATGLAGLYMGYQTNKTVAQYNSNIGMPTQANGMSLGLGLPYLANGLYGALGGGQGQGGFGCGSSNGNGMGGAFGYPGSMYGGQPGGGMYMPGSQMGMMAGGGFMSPGGMMNGMMGGGGYMSPGGMMNGMMGGGGYMSPGGMMNGMMGGGGFMSPGGMMGGGGYMSPGGMMVSGGFMSAGGMMGDPSMIQMQQQMQQMQMQQYQTYMQQQQQKQQVVGGLQQELYGLLYRIQQVQYGGGLSGGLGGGGYLGGGGSSSPNGGTISGGNGGGQYQPNPYQNYPYQNNNNNNGTATTPLNGR